MERLNIQSTIPLAELYGIVALQEDEEAEMNKKTEENNIFKILRIIRNKKVSELAKTLDVTPANISSIEAGRHYPSKRLLKDYANALGVTPEFISNNLPNTGENDERYEDFLFRILKKVIYLDQEEKFLNK